MMGDLHTTNVVLTVMAVVSVLEALVLIGIAIGGFMVYRRIMQLVNDLEQRQIAPVRAKVDAILGDVKTLTARVSEEAERVDHAIHGTINRVDDTAEHLKSTVRDKVSYVAGVIRGVRAAIVSLLHTEHRPKPPATAAGRL
jgi:pyrimidine operon attenuation protein/uracil phosphoribosyltransferase